MDRTDYLKKIPIEEISIGMEATYSKTVTDDDVMAFAEISGDKNPIHIDDEYASNSRYHGRIAHGLMPASYFSALFGTEIPGEGCVYKSQSLRFRRPVYIGDNVTATVTVKGVIVEKKLVFFRTVCRVNNKVVIDGEAEIFIP